MVAASTAWSNFKASGGQLKCLSGKLEIWSADDRHIAGPFDLSPPAAFDKNTIPEPGSMRMLQAKMGKMLLERGLPAIETTLESSTASREDKLSACEFLSDRLVESKPDALPDEGSEFDVYLDRWLADEMQASKDKAETERLERERPERGAAEYRQRKLDEACEREAVEAPKRAAAAAAAAAKLRAALDALDFE